MGKSLEYFLVKRAQAGEIKAFAELVEKNKKKIYSLILNLTGSYHDADDLSQETFLRAYRSLGSFKASSSFYTWLYRIAINTTINYLKKQKRLSEVPLNVKLSSPVERQTLVKEEESPREKLQKKELRETIRKTITELPINQRLAATLVILEGISYEEAARVLRCPKGTLSWRLFQARKALVRQLRDYFE